ncbi:MAG: hypothetical protein Q7J47_06035 [Azoarcus sp.]|nr:hypothetical protein [Azoarcus sp.]
MYIDSQLQFAARQVLSAGTTASTNSIDRGQVAAGVLVPFDGLLLVAAIHSNAGTVQVLLEHSDDNSTFTTLQKSAAFSGTGVQTIDLPPLSKRYLKTSFISSGAANVSAWLGTGSDAWASTTARGME